MEIPQSLKQLQHLHFRFRATIKNPPKDELEGVNFMTELVEGIGMEMAVLSRGQTNPIAWYSEPEHNQGMTLSAILTTSNATMHIWDNPGVLEFDLYSCACFNPVSVTEFVDAWVGIKEIEWCDLTNRETGSREGYPLGRYKDNCKQADVAQLAEQ